MILINPELDFQIHMVFNNLKRSFWARMNKALTENNLGWDKSKLTAYDLLSLK